ncbi:hypothetical protein JCM11251_001554 [Rhodosporidiobolus azoricus]
MRSKQRHRSQSSTAPFAFAAGSPSRSGKAGGEASSSGSKTKLTSFFSGGGAGSDGEMGRPQMPRSASSNEVLTSWRTGREGGNLAEGRKASDASWMSGSSAVRFDLPAEAAQAGDILHVRQLSSTTNSSYSRSAASSAVFSQAAARGHARHPSSATSVHPTSLALARTASSTTSSSTASSDFPPTPAQNAGGAGSVVYRSRSSSGSAVNVSLPSRKGKEPEHLPPLSPTSPKESSWRAGFPAVSHIHATEPLSSGTKRASMPPVIDPRFTFPMRRGGPNGSGSGSGQGVVRNPLGLGLGPEEDDRGRSSGNRADSSASQGGGTSYIASLGSLPLVDGTGRQLPSHRSYAPPPVLSDSPAQSSPDLTSPSLPALSPIEPFSPTSPLTTTFTTPEVPASSKLLPAFAPSTPSHRKLKPKRRGTFSARRRSSSITRASSRRGRPRRRSTASSASSIRGPTFSRSSSLPDLRSDPTDVEAYRRPSIPFSTFEPRGPCTRSGDSLRREEIPIVFPSKRSGSGLRPNLQTQAHGSPPKPPRPFQAPQVRHERKSSRPVVVRGACEALVFAHPRIVVVSGSPASSIAGEEAAASPIAHAPSPPRRARGEARLCEGPLTDGEVDHLLDEMDRSSVRRVMLENEASRAERAAWSDSATKALGFGLSLRMASRERDGRERRETASSAATAMRRRKEKRRVRRDVERRRESEAAGWGTESEWEYGSGRRRVGRKRSAAVGAVLNREASAPHPSPPMPTSFEPFTQLGRKLTLKRTRSRGKNRERRPSDATTPSSTPASVGLGIIDGPQKDAGEEVSRQASTASTALGRTTVPRTPKTATVRGKPIRHLQASQSLDSLYDRTNLPARPANRAVLPADLYDVETKYGQAVSSPPDQPSPTKAETRRPSVRTQNPFLTLPPHLHHLLRSPEPGRYMPSRPAPPVPSSSAANRGISHSPSLPVLAERDLNRRFSAGSAASAARLGLALEEQLGASLRNSVVKPIAALPVATSAPLVWQARDENWHCAGSEDQVDQPPVSSAPDVSWSRSISPSLSAIAASGSGGGGGATSDEDSPAYQRRPGSSFASWITTSEDPFKVPSAMQTSSPTSPASLRMRKLSQPRPMRTPSSPRAGRPSRASSGSSVVRMNVESDFDDLFFFPPRPAQTARRPPAIDTSSNEAPGATEREKLRIGEVAVSQCHRSFSMGSLSHEETLRHERKELDVPSAGGEGRMRQPTPQKSLEALVLMPSTSDEGAPSVYQSTTEPPEFSTATSGPSSHAYTKIDRQIHCDPRPPTSQSAAYATADEGATIDFEASSLPDVMLFADSLALGPLTRQVDRPLPTPMQTPWPATSWAREYLGSFGSSRGGVRVPPPLGPSASDKRRASGGSGSGSGRSFLHFDEEPLSDRGAVSPSSFIDFSPPSSAPHSPVESSPTATLPLSPTAPRSPTYLASRRVTSSSVPRSSYLSVNSTHFVNPSRRSPQSNGSGSHYSGLENRLDDFPHPPQSFAEDPASDSDDERDENGDEDGDATFFISRSSKLGDEKIEFDKPPSRSSRVVSSALHTSRSHSSLSIHSIHSVQTQNEERRPSSEDGIRLFSSRRVTNLSLLPTTTEQPISSQPYLEMDESAESGREQTE